MQMTPEIRYFAVARMTRQLERMVDDYDIHQLQDSKLEEMAKEVERLAHQMRTHCINCIRDLE